MRNKNDIEIKENLQLGDFKLMKKLGNGGMGEVWLAEQSHLDRLVAVKILLPEFNKNKRFIDKFKNEIKLSAKLNHPNIISAYAAGNEKGFYYFAMPYVEGIELYDRLNLDKIISEREALNIIKKIAYGLEYSWNKFQIIHRDIKPSNIMIDCDGIPMLMDMGISKVATNNKLSKDEYIEGTPHYMSPEQARGECNLDFSSDIYSLGILLYQMLTGTLPFNSENVREIMIYHQCAPFPSPKEINPKITKASSYLLEIMLAKNCMNRHGSWRKLIDDIDLVLQGTKPRTYKYIKSLRKTQEEFIPKVVEKTQVINRRLTLLSKILNSIKRFLNL